jgi:predicted ATPase
MLTRLKVSNFKNLLDVDVRFGPFTCIAGANASGKSNLFDAIQFLSALANNTLMDAALSIRSEHLASGDIRSLFHHAGDTYAESISFEAEMIVPKEATDDLGQLAKAGITFLRYKLVLAYRSDDSALLPGTLEIRHEELTQINRREANKHLPFAEGKTEWRKSVLSGRRTSSFISTEDMGSETQIRLAQDGVGGRPKQFLAYQLPRTVLSTVNAVESPTALIARREMQSWRMFHLEPSALRKPDDFRTPPGLDVNGAHLAATLYQLAASRNRGNGHSIDITWVYEQVGQRLAEFIDDVYGVSVDADQKRQLLTVEVTDRNRTTYPARSLSDGTLRFLALVVLEMDPNVRGVLCFEEPENGVHPERIPAILRLLQDIVVDLDEPVSVENPLRQVIVNTHSPTVVMSVPEGALLVAETKEVLRENQRVKVVTFSALDDTWRAEPGKPTVAKGKLLAYLNPAPPDLGVSQERDHEKRRHRRIIDRPDLQPFLPYSEMK